MRGNLVSTILFCIKFTCLSKYIQIKELFFPLPPLWIKRTHIAATTWQDPFVWRRRKFKYYLLFALPVGFVLCLRSNNNRRLLQTCFWGPSSLTVLYCALLQNYIADDMRCKRCEGYLRRTLLLNLSGGVCCCASKRNYVTHFPSSRTNFWCLTLLSRVFLIWIWFQIDLSSRTNTLPKQRVRWRSSFNYK